MKMSKKELAFLRDLYVSGDWTERFTAIFDENFKLAKNEKVLYVNAGTGNHALSLCAKLKKGGEIFAICENEEMRQIAQAKADAINAKITFSTKFTKGEFETVLANATFVEPDNLAEFVNRLGESSSKNVAFFLVSAHSFGEIFSFLWETLFNLNLVEKSVEIERLISTTPTVSNIEEIAENAGLTEVKSFTKNEIFEFKNGEEFINSPLIANFLLPNWLKFLNEKEKKKVLKNLVKTIDADDQDLSFTFSVKATLITGEKSKK